MEQNIFNNTHSCIPFRRYKFRFNPTEKKKKWFLCSSYFYTDALYTRWMILAGAYFNSSLVFESVFSWSGAFVLSIFYLFSFNVVETEILIAKWSAWRGGRRSFTLASSPEYDLCALAHYFITPPVSLSTHRLFSPTLQTPMALLRNCDFETTFFTFFTSSHFTWLCICLTRMNLSFWFL